MTVRDALIESLADVIVPNDAASISPDMPAVYLFVLSSTAKKYGYETTLQLAVGETTQEKLETLYDDIYAAIGTKVTASDATVFPLVAWEHGASVLMLDGTWGRRSTLKVISEELEA